MPTSPSVDSEIGAKGAFITALVATGIESDVASAVRSHVFTRDAFEPDDACTSVCDELFADFMAIRETASGDWARLAAMRSRYQGAPAVDEADGDLLAQLQ